MSKFSLAKSRVDLTGGPIFKNLVIFTIPILLGAIVTQLYNVADSVIVGRFVSANALAAVSAGAPVMSIINLFMIGLSAGTNVIIAQRVGAKDKESLQRSVSTIACLTLLCAIGITIIGLAACKPMLLLLDTPKEIIQDSTYYLIVIYIGTTGNLVYHMGNGVLQGMGDSTWPFLFLLLCSILNVILDLIAVLVLGWGVLGVAIATALSQLVSGVGVFLRLNSGGYGVRLTFSNIRIDSSEAKSIIGIGLPAAIQNIGNAIAALCVQSSVNTFGSSFIAANSIVSKINNMVDIPIMALSTALCTFVGQNMGIFRLDRIKEGINKCIFSLFLLGIGLTGLLIGLRGVFPMMFSTDPDVVAYSAQGLLIMSIICPFTGIDRCLVNAMRGAGKSVVPMITAQFGAFSRIPLAYFLGERTGDYLGIFYALLIASFLRMIAIAVYYYGGGWKRAVQKFEAMHRRPDRAQISP